MASTTGPDLEVGRLAVENLMDDSCVIVRPGSGPGTLDPVTGTVTDPVTTTVYDHTSTGSGGRSLADAEATGGMCTVSAPSSRQPSYRVEGGAMILNENYAGKIPVDAPTVNEGDVLTVMSSRRDPQLIGQRYRIAAVIESTYAISRRMTLEPVA